MADPVYFPEGNEPKRTDTQWRTLQKILGALRDVLGAFTGVIASLTYVTPTQELITVAAAGTPVALGADVKFRRVVIVCNKDEARTANVGNVFVGCETGANKQPFTLSPGAEFVLEPPRGTSWSLKDWFVDAANNGDGVVITIS